MNYTILTINPGSTSTKIAVFINDEELFKIDISHQVCELEKFESIEKQFSFRRDTILQALAQQQFDMGNLSAVVGRGGFVRSIPSGTYRINERMIYDLQHPWNQHESNLGGLIAKELADKLNIPSFIVDPVVIDEMDEIARITGLKNIERVSIFHALNQKATARKLAEQLSIPYEQLNLIVAHMGGGVTIGAHKHGRVIDVNNGLDAEGPFSPERAGTLPLKPIVNMCFNGNYTEKDILEKLKGKGGLVSYFDTSDAKKVEAMAENGDMQAGLVLNAMVYNIVKGIGSYAAVLKGKVDGIVLTGGLAHSKRITNMIREYVEFIAPIYIFPGENEMESLCMGALRVLRGQEMAKDY